MTNSTPNFYALLIGIDFYFPHRLPEGSYKNLGGCVRDINHVETYLKETFNLTPQQIIKLTATASDDPTQPQETPELLPTYANIVAKFKELTAKAQPQDQVYIHYSGHGGRAKTIFENIKGSGGIDEALVPCDIGQENSQYLRDLEFAKLLEEMVNKELVVTMVLDSCHSGGATREMSGDDRIRGEGFTDMTPRPTESLVAPLEELTNNWQSLTGNSRNMTVVNGLLPEPKGYTLIAACRDNEFAYEDVFEGTERNGALTYFLLKTLRQFGKELSTEELFNRISNFVHNKFDRQTPMLMGETERTFFGGKAVTTNRNTAVMDVNLTKNQVKLQMGEANGIKNGAEFDIFKFGTRDFKDSQNKIATVKVVEVGASDCWAKVTTLYGFRTINNQLEEGMIEIGFPAVYLSPGLKQIRKFRILLPDSLPENSDVNIALLPITLQAKKEQVEGHRWIEFCTEDEKDDNVDYFVRLNSEGEYVILDRQKESIESLSFNIKVNEPESTKNLINRLIHIAKYDSIMNLDNENAFASLNGKLKVELIKSEKPKIKVLSTGENVPELEEGEENIYLRVRNESNRTLNITLLNLDADFSVDTFYLDGVSVEVLEPGQEKRTKKPLAFKLPDNYQEALNVIKVFATVSLTNFELLKLPALDQSRKGFGDQEPQNSLEKFFSTVVDENNPKRKITVPVDTSDEWTTEKIEVMIKSI